MVVEPQRGVVLYLYLEFDRVVGRIHQVLPRTEIPLGCLNGCMAEQQLDLLKLTTSGSAQLGTCAATIVRRDARNSSGLDY